MSLGTPGERKEDLQETALRSMRHLLQLRSLIILVIREERRLFSNKGDGVLFPARVILRNADVQDCEVHPPNVPILCLTLLVYQGSGFHIRNLLWLHI